MRLASFASLLAAALAIFPAGRAPVAAELATRISGPYAHSNLAIYLVHGASAEGEVPLTLQEALAKGAVQVVETGQVNELQIENTGGREVFIQAGDIVKGGRQDRVLSVSLMLPPGSGRVPIASFCVEQGRWAARGSEDQQRFSSALEAMPSRAALLAMAAPSEPRAAEPVQPVPAQRGRTVPGAGSDVGSKQHKVWEQVASTQGKLSSGLSSQMQARESETSLQLTLEQDKLKAARAAYIAEIEAAGLKEPDVVGYVVAINGRMSSANVYPSNGLFRKMWGKQLAAAVTEAIGERSNASPPAPPKPAEAGAFLAAAEKGKMHERALADGMKLETRDADGALYNEARSADGRWVHRNYLAK